MVARTRRATDPASYPVRARPLPKKAEWADRIFQLIPAVGHQPISQKQLALASNLKPRQVEQAVAYLRDTFPEFPLVSSQDGYCFSVDGDVVAKFGKTRAKVALTTIRRSWEGAIKPYLSHINDQAVAVIVQKQYSRIMEDLAELTR